MKQVLIAFDQLINAMLGGWADETLSSRCWRLRKRQPYTALRAVIDGLFFWEAEHCRMAFRSERLRLQAPPEVR